MPESTPQESMTAEMAEELAFARDIDERYRRANPASLTLGQTADWRRWRLFLQRDAELASVQATAGERLVELSAALERVRVVETALREIIAQAPADEAAIEARSKMFRESSVPEDEPEAIAADRQALYFADIARAALNPPSATTGQET